MQGPLDGKSALITGAVGGIGLIAARALAQTGCGLHLVGQNFSKLYEVAMDIRDTYGVTVEQHMGNPANPVDAEAIGMASADAEIFVSCTGNLPRGTLEDIGDERWRKSWEAAVFAPLNMAREMAGHMNDEERGLIILVIDAPVDTDCNDLCASASGAVLKSLVVGLAQELTKGVRIVGLLTERNVEARSLSEAITRLALAQDSIPTGTLLTTKDAQIVEDTTSEDKMAFPEPETFPVGAKLIEGVWTQSLTAKEKTEGRPALFLDRDGVVVEEAHYLHKVEDVQLTPNAADVIRTANEKNIPVILVTNQAGIGYGLFEWDAFVDVQAKILGELAESGAHIDGVFACPFSAKGKGIYFHEDHPARKPNPGMLFHARDLLGVDLSKSWIVGDRDLDLLAGKNAGLAGGVHVLTGHGSKDGARESALAVGDESFEALGAQNLHEAMALLKVLA